MGVAYGSCAVVLLAGYVASGWACHSRPTLFGCTLWAGRWVCSLSGMTFAPGHLLPWAWQEVKGEQLMTAVDSS